MGRFDRDDAHYGRDRARRSKGLPPVADALVWSQYKALVCRADETLAAVARSGITPAPAIRIELSALAVAMAELELRLHQEGKDIMDQLHELTGYDGPSWTQHVARRQAVPGMASRDPAGTSVSATLDRMKREAFGEV